MKKDVLFNNLSSCKRSIMILLLSICTCYASFAQTRQITGKVTAASDGQTLPGVSITIKGTSTGVTADANGAFKLSVQPNATLVFSFLGYVNQEVVVGSGSVYNVKLAATVNNLNEVVVVSVGYGTTKRTDLTGSISSISAAQIAKVPVTSLDQALQGRAAGVQVTNNDGAPGNSVSVVIRVLVALPVTILCMWLMATLFRAG